MKLSLPEVDLAPSILLIVRIRAPFTDAQHSQMQLLVWQQHASLSLSFSHARTHTLGRSLLPASTLSGGELDWTIFEPIKCFQQLEKYVII